MTVRDEIRARLARVARALGPAASELVLVGGCAPATYELTAAAGDLRPTEDVDFLVDAATWSAYERRVRRLKRSVGLREKQQDGAPLCRYELGEEILDLMPTGAEVLGFGNPWYAAAMQAAEFRDVAPDVSLRVVPPLLFVATKLVAFAGRGARDPLLSHDLEDIVHVFIGSPFLPAVLRLGRAEVDAFVRARLAELLRNAGLGDLWMAHAGPDEASQLAGAAILDEVRIAVHGPGGPVRVRVVVEGGGLAFTVPRLALAWETVGSGSRNAVAQRVLDAQRRSGGKFLPGGLRCLAPSPFSGEEAWLPVVVRACECPRCGDVDRGGVLPCWDCDRCLEESEGDCPTCELPARWGSSRDDPASRDFRFRVGTLGTASPACLMHDHRRCPRGWTFSGGQHVGGCNCRCHGGDAPHAGPDQTTPGDDAGGVDE